MSRPDIDLDKKLTRKQFLVIVGASAVAAALGAKACAPKSEIQLPPDQQEFFRVAGNLLRDQGLGSLSLRMTVYPGDQSSRWQEFSYRDNQLVDTIFPNNIKNESIILSPKQKSFHLVNGEIINTSEKGFVYAFAIEGVTGGDGKSVSKSHISKVKVFDFGNGRGILFSWSPNAPVDQVQIEKEIYLNVEAESEWPWHIDVKTVGDTIPENIAVIPSTLWRTNGINNDQKIVLSDLVKDWRNLIKKDTEGKESRLNLIRGFAEKTARTIKGGVLPEK